MGLAGAASADGNQHAVDEVRDNNDKNASQTRQNAYNKIVNTEGKGHRGPWEGLLKRITAICGEIEHKGCAGEAQALRLLVAEAKGIATGEGAVAQSLQRMEKAMIKGNTTPALPTTWAAVAAAPRDTRTLPTPNRYTVRVQAPEMKELDAPEALKEVKKVISGAIAVRKLRSGDIDVYVPNETARERALATESTAEVRIIRQDFQVEVQGVPITLPLGFGPQEESNPTVRQIITDTGCIAPGLEITRIQWLHGKREHEERLRGAVKTRGTLIIGFRTEEMRRRVIQHGIIIRSQIFGATAYERSLTARRCFRCQQWGHTQHACGKQARCGHCAGEHDTKMCKSTKVACANCGKNHKAWYARDCAVYGIYFNGILQKRAYAFADAERMRIAREAERQRTDAEGFSLVGTKRKAVAEPRRVGRPTLIESAAREQGQTRLLAASQEQPARNE